MADRRPRRRTPSGRPGAGSHVILPLLNLPLALASRDALSGGRRRCIPRIQPSKTHTARPHFAFRSAPVNRVWQPPALAGCRLRRQSASTQPPVRLARASRSRGAAGPMSSGRSCGTACLMEPPWAPSRRTANGSFVAMISIPSNASGGAHTVWACQYCDGAVRPAIRASAPFTVTGVITRAHAGHHRTHARDRCPRPVIREASQGRR